MVKKTLTKSSSTYHLFLQNKNIQFRYFIGVIVSRFICIIMNDTMCVYKIVNSQNGNEYVGSTLLGFEWRKRKHLRELRKGKHHNRHLQNAFIKYGEGCFSFSILEVITDPTKLLDAEERWLIQINPIYNVMRDIKSHIGVKRSDETCKKISVSNTGKHHTQETKDKLSKLNTGKKQSLTTIEKKRIGNFRSVLQLNTDGSLIKEWVSPTIAAHDLNIKRTMIYECISGRKPTYRGFIWRRK